MSRNVCLLLGFVLITGCQSAVQNAVKEAKYSAYELVGYQKRDLFKKQAAQVKENQEDTQESLKDALERLQDVYKVEGGSLEKQYRRLNGSYEDAQKEAQGVEASIRQLETIAGDLFTEWKKEISQIESKDLRARSTEQWSASQDRYLDFHGRLKKSEGKIAPVLTQLRDQVLFLKHNLNSRAVQGLKKESVKIQANIEALIREMNQSIQQADQYIQTL